MGGSLGGFSLHVSSETKLRGIRGFSTTQFGGFLGRKIVFFPHSYYTDYIIKENINVYTLKGQRDESLTPKRFQVTAYVNISRYPELSYGKTGNIAFSRISKPKSVFWCFNPLPIP